MYYVPVAVRLSGLLCVFLAYRNTVYGTRVVVQSKLRSMKIQSLHTRRYIHTYIHMMYDVWTVLHVTRMYRTIDTGSFVSLPASTHCSCIPSNPSYWSKASTCNWTFITFVLLCVITLAMLGGSKASTCAHTCIDNVPGVLWKIRVSVKRKPWRDVTGPNLYFNPSFLPPFLPTLYQ